MLNVSDNGNAADNVKKPLRIVFPFVGDTVGGSHISDFAIIKRLPINRYIPAVVRHSEHDIFTELMNEVECEHHILPLFVPRGLKDILRNPYRYISAVFSAKRFLENNKIDFVQCSDGPIRYIWFYAAKLAGVKYIHYQHTFVNNNIEKKFAYRFFDSIICNSEYTASSLPHKFRTNKDAIAYPIIETKYKPQDKAELRQSVIIQHNLDPEKKLIGFISNMQPQKRPDIFIECVKLLKSKGVNAQYIMVGAFYQGIEKQLKEMVKHYGLENDIVFTGFCADSQRYLRAFDILIAPAINEAFGRVVVEAMMLETPVVASASGGHLEIVKHNLTGFQAGASSPKQFVEHAIKIINNSEKVQAITSNALADVNERFSPEAQMQKIIHLYELNNPH